MRETIKLYDIKVDGNKVILPKEVLEILKIGLDGNAKGLLTKDCFVILSNETFKDYI